MVASIYLIALSFLIGNLLVHHLPTLPNISAIEVFWFMPLALLILYRHTLLRLLGGLSLGICLTLASALSHHNDILSDSLDHSDVQMGGVISSLPKVKKGMTSFIFKPYNKQLPERILLKVYSKLPDQQLQLNTHLQVVAKLKRPHGYANPRIFDYEKWLFTKRIGARGYIRNYTIINQAMMTQNMFYQTIGHVRQTLFNKIYQHKDKLFQNASIASLGLGFSGALDHTQNDTLIATGTRHLFAISGLHINLIFGFFFILFKYLWSHSFLRVTLFPARSFALLASFPRAIFYALLAGFTLPTQRALIALLCIVIIWQYKRTIPAGQVLCIVLLTVLIYNPLSSLSLSFWLSFSATSFIVFYLFTDISTIYQYRWRRFISFQIYLTIAMAMLSMFLFSRGSLTALVANLLAVPYVSFVVLPINLLTLCSLSFNDTLGLWLLTLTSWSFDAFWYTLELCKRYGIEWYWQPPLWVFIFAIIGFALIRILPDKYYKSLAFILLFPLLFNQNMHSARLNAKDIDVHFMDIGQGTSILVKTANHQLIYDVGPKFNSGFNTSDVIVIPYLRSLGITKVDTLIISHNDNDHAGSVNMFLDKIEVQKILSGEPLINVSSEHCHNGQEWIWDDVRFTILHPNPDSTEKGNNASCVLRIDNGSYSVLLTGDIEASAENALVQSQRHRIDSDVLLVPHHGSKTSSTQRFLSAVSPKVAIITSGYRNQYHFPHKEVIKRYHQIKLYNTATKGLVNIKLTAQQIKITTWRDTYQRYWVSYDI